MAYICPLPFFIICFYLSGLNAAEKKLVKTAKPKVKIWVEDDDTIVNKFKSGPVLSDTTKFKLGEEYEKTYMGRTGRVSNLSHVSDFESKFCAKTCLSKYSEPSL